MQPNAAVSEMSLLSQIIQELNKMDDEQQRKLLMQLRKNAVLKEVARFDSIAAPPKQNSMTDEEADNYISGQRKQRYEQQSKA